MKRGISLLEGVYNSTRNKKPRLVFGLEDNSNILPWISATKTYNYMNNDCLVDWLKLYGRTVPTSNGNKTPTQNNESFTQFLRRKGIEFEKGVVGYLAENHEIISLPNYYNLENVEKTTDLMKRGIKIIHSGSLKNDKNHTYGLSDLLIRSDYIPVLFGDEYDSADLYHPATKLGVDINYHYRVIDIKFSTLKLASDGIHLLNQGKIPAYKSQIYIYNDALSKVQGYDSKKGYILGRKWKYSSCGDIFSGNSCFDKLGLIDFKDRDFDFVNKTRLAINWYRDLLLMGESWTISPPSRSELYPNMCVDSGEWNSVKENLAREISDITMLWQCGPKNRDNAMMHGVDSWKDSNCNGKILGLGKSYENTVNDIIKINTTRGMPPVSPSKIQNNYLDWQNMTSSDLFVDFETLSDICQGGGEFSPVQMDMNMIFMIGVGWLDVEGNWQYKNFIAESLSHESEKDILIKFINFVNTYSDPKLFYWHAERSFWSRALKKNGLLTDANMNFDWVDLCRIFRTEPIVIKNCFNFGLKNVAKCLKEHNLITTELNAECLNGMMAMVKAWNCYERGGQIRGDAIMKDIGVYNEFDCRVLYDILNYLRKKHT